MVKKKKAQITAMSEAYLSAALSLITIVLLLCGYVWTPLVLGFLSLGLAVHIFWNSKGRR